jgi:transcriptional regulator with XRE-family HTH domain
MENFHVAMGHRLVARRKQLRLTQEELAELADLKPQMVSSTELGATVARPENIVKLCKALNISTDYLMTGAIVDMDILHFNKSIEGLTAFQLHNLEEIVTCYVSACTEKK